MFNAFEEGYLCLSKRFLFLSIRRLHLISFLREMYVEKVLQELFWAPSTKIDLNAALY